MVSLTIFDSFADEKSVIHDEIIQTVQLLFRYQHLRSQLSYKMQSCRTALLQCGRSIYFI